jgi:hypothetical protein
LLLLSIHQSLFDNILLPLARSHLSRTARRETAQYRSPETEQYAEAHKRQKRPGKSVQTKIIGRHIAVVVVIILAENVKRKHKEQNDVHNPDEDHDDVPSNHKARSEFSRDKEECLQRYRNEVGTNRRPYNVAVCADFCRIAKHETEVNSELSHGADELEEKNDPQMENVPSSVAYHDWKGKDGRRLCDIARARWVRKCHACLRHERARVVE